MSVSKKLGLLLLAGVFGFGGLAISERILTPDRGLVSTADARSGGPRPQR